MSGKPSSSPLPCQKALEAAFQLSCDLDKPIKTDYWADSITKTVAIGIDEDTSEKRLIRSDEEYSSNIEKLYKAVDAYILLTENSIYIVSTNIPKKKYKPS